MWEKVEINTSEIALDQFLKWANVVSSGGEAKNLIRFGKVKVNGEEERRRSKKLIPGDRINVNDRIKLVVESS